MPTLDAATATAEQHLVVAALTGARRLVEAIDTLQAALGRDDQVRYSALRTQVEQALPRAESVLEFLRTQ